MLRNASHAHCCGRQVIFIAAKNRLSSLLRDTGYTHRCGIQAMLTERGTRSMSALSPLNFSVALAQTYTHSPVVEKQADKKCESQIPVPCFLHVSNLTFVNDFSEQRRHLDQTGMNKMCAHRASGKDKAKVNKSRPEEIINPQALTQQ